MWLASVSFYCEHQCRVWYGSQVEVWSTVNTQDIHFIPVSSIKCCVVYSQQEVDFGRIIGTEREKWCVILTQYYVLNDCPRF